MKNKNVFESHQSIKTIEEELSGEKILPHKEVFGRLIKKISRKPCCEGIPTDVLEVSSMKRS